MPERGMTEKANLFVKKGTWIINIVLLVCHIYFVILFKFYNADILFWFNCGSVAIYLLSFELLRRKKAGTYIYLVFLEIYAFMIVSIICLGWEFGFQHYCIAFIASLCFSDFFMNGSRTANRVSLLLGVFNASIYIALRFWTQYHPYVYQIDNTLVKDGMYVMNTLLGFSFLIMYFSIYSKTVNKLEEELRQMAERDALTGLYNRRKMMELLGAEMDSVENKNLVVAMLDVDLFKRVNDTYGHVAGDEVLKRLADTLQEHAKDKEDFYVCRWGGEEFFILYHYKDTKATVMEEFERIRQEIQQQEIPYEEELIKMTITIGLSFYQKGMSLNDLLKEADALLYKGKEAGRNCVRCSE